MLEQLPEAVSDGAWADQAADVVDIPSRRVVADPRRAALLQGEWLGHPLHPMLTDLPIGFWTAASVLDLIGGTAMRPAAQRMVALGVLCVPLTAAAGLADYSGFKSAHGRRVAAVHALGNASATGVYLASWLARRRGHHRVGAVLALGGATLATVAGLLGGHLVFAGDEGAE